MPKRKYSGTRRRSKRARRRLFRRRRSRVPRLTGPVKNRSLVKLRYVETVTLNPAVGLGADYVFRANSIHDPNFTGSGHQPYGHDQLATLYDNYIVVGSKITCEFISTGDTSATTDAVVGISLEDDSVANTLPHVWLEQPKSTWKTIGPADGSKGRAKCSKTYSARKFFGIANTKDTQDRYGAQFGSDPAEQAWYHCIVSPVNGADDIQLVNMLVTIEYTVLCTELKDLGQS